MSKLIDKRFTAWLEAMENLLNQIEEFRSHQTEEMSFIYEEAQEFDTKKLDAIHDLNELTKFEERHKKFQESHQGELRQIKKYVDAYHLANEAFYNTAIDHRDAKDDELSKFSGEQQKLRDQAINAQINKIINQRYKNNPGKRLKINSDEKWVAEDKLEQKSTPQRKLVQQGMAKAKTFIGSLAEQGNLKALQKKHEYYSLRQKYDFFEDFFKLNESIENRKLQLQEQQDQQFARKADMKYAEEEFEKTLDQDISQKINTQAAIVTGEKSIYEPFLSDEGLNEKEKNKERELNLEPSLKQVITAHDKMRHYIDEVNREIAEVEKVRNKTDAKLMQWKFPQEKFGYEPRDNKDVIGRLEEKEKGLRAYKIELQAIRDEAVAKYKELIPYVENRIADYFEEYQDSSAESIQRSNYLLQHEFDDKIEKFAKQTELDKASSLRHLARINQQLFQNLYNQLDKQPELKYIAEWKENNPSLQKSTSDFDDITSRISQLQHNQGVIYGYTNSLLQEVETELCMEVKNGAGNIASLAELQNDIIQFIANDLIQWNRYLYLRTQQGGLSVETTRLLLNEYAIASQNMMQYIMQDIASKFSIDNRTLAVERWISIMRTSYDKGDYQTASVIQAALNAPSIQRLTKTWMGVSHDSKHFLSTMIDVSSPPTVADNKSNLIGSLQDKLQKVNIVEWLMEGNIFQNNLAEIKEVINQLKLILATSDDVFNNITQLIDELLQDATHDKVTQNQIENLQTQVKEFITSIAPEFMDEKTLVVMGKSAMMQGPIMAVDPKNTDSLIAQVKNQEDSKRGLVQKDSARQTRSMPVGEPVQPSTIMAVIESKKQEAALLSQPSTRADAILNPTLRKIVVARRLEITEQFIHEANAAALNPGRRLIEDALFVNGFHMSRKELSVIKHDNKQIYYHSLIANPVLADMLKGIELKSTHPNYKKTRHLIRKINDAIIHPVSEKTLESLLQKIGFTSIPSESMKLIQDENQRLHQVTRQIAADNPGLREKKINKKLVEWLQKNKQGYIGAGKVYVTPQPAAESKVEKNSRTPLVEKQLSNELANKLVDNLVLVFDKLLELLEKMEGYLDKLVEEKNKSLHSALHAQSIFNPNNKITAKHREVKPIQNAAGTRVTPASTTPKLFASQQEKPVAGEPSTTPPSPRMGPFNSSDKKDN